VKSGNAFPLTDIDVMTILYTSDMTGYPKGASLRRNFGLIQTWRRNILARRWQMFCQVVLWDSTDCIFTVTAKTSVRM
jgi:long-subunit acyl-CoA synthetase (AMP-forming)